MNMQSKVLDAIDRAVSQVGRQSEIPPSPPARDDGLPSALQFIPAEPNNATETRMLVEGPRDSRNKTEIFPTGCQVANIQKLIPLAEWLDRSAAKKLVKLQTRHAEWRAQIEAQAPEKIKRAAQVERSTAGDDMLAILKTAGSREASLTASTAAVATLKDSLRAWANRECAPVLIAVLSNLHEAVQRRLFEALEAHRQERELYGGAPEWPRTVAHSYKTGAWTMCERNVASHLRRIRAGLHEGNASPKNHISIYCSWESVEKLA